MGHCSFPGHADRGLSPTRAREARFRPGAAKAHRGESLSTDDGEAAEHCLDAPQLDEHESAERGRGDVRNLALERFEMGLQVLEEDRVSFKVFALVG